MVLHQLLCDNTCQPVEVKHIIFFCVEIHCAVISVLNGGNDRASMAMPRKPRLKGASFGTRDESGQKHPPNPPPCKSSRTGFFEAAAVEGNIYTVLVPCSCKIACWRGLQGGGGDGSQNFGALSGCGIPRSIPSHLALVTVALPAESSVTVQMLS